MKIRHGFVSNSSSSSFIVKKLKTEFDLAMDIDFKKITEEDIKKLEDYGFKEIDINVLSVIDDLDHDWMNKDNNCPTNHYLFYKVSCNQDEVMAFLIYNKIPFKASCHYGHEYFFYDGEDKFMKFRNPGVEFEMYGCIDMNVKPVYENIKDYIEYYERTLK